MFREELQKAMLKKNLTVAALTDRLHLGQSTLTRLLKNQRELELSYVLKVVRYLLPNDEISIMSEFMDEISKPKNFKLAIEYCSTHSLLEKMQKILERASQLKNDELSEIVEVYRIQLSIQKSELSGMELYNKVRHLKFRHPEPSILVRLQELYSLYFMEEYNFFQISIGDLANQIKEISDPFMRESYTVRYAEMIHVHKLNVLNDVNAARFHCDQVLKCENVGFMYHGSALFTKGLSYLYENGDKSLIYLELAKELYLNNERKDVAENVEKTIEFIKVVYNKPIDYFLDIENKSYWLIKQGRKEEGLQILHDIDIKSNDEDPYRYFFIGEAKNNTIYLYRALKSFIKRGDRFLANMVVTSLLTLGESEEIISLILDK